MTSRRDVLKLGAAAGAALTLPAFVNARNAAGHGSHAAPGREGRATAAAGAAATGFALRFDGLCSVVQLMNGDTIEAIDVGLMNYRINSRLPLRRHTPTLRVPLTAVLSGSAPPDAVSTRDAFWNLDGWILDFAETETAMKTLVVNAEKIEHRCPETAAEWHTLAWMPFATEFAPGAQLDRNWRRRTATSALVRLRRGHVERNNLRVPLPPAPDGLYFVKDRAGNTVGDPKPRFFKGFFHYDIADAQVVVIGMTRQPELNPDERQIRIRATDDTEIVNLPVGPHLERDAPLADVAVYYDLLETPLALGARGVPVPLTQAEFEKVKDCTDLRTDGCGCCPGYRFKEAAGGR